LAAFSATKTLGTTNPGNKRTNKEEPHHREKSKQKQINANFEFVEKKSSLRFPSFFSNNVEEAFFGLFFVIEFGWSVYRKKLDFFVEQTAD
jgi:hypothetical protein